MSREIKFRAWFPKEYYSEPHMAYWTENDDFGGRSSTWDLIEIMQSGKPNNPIYMQYTGLKDKNGVEIWEGDIVDVSRSEPKRYSIIYSPDHAAFRLRSHKNKGASYNMEQNTSFIEVIGNIYENPELLTKEAA